jgi:hypothetical protein
MTAKRHGRPGKAGRPSDPVGALRELADYAIVPAMKALARKAADSGLSLKPLAGAAGIRYAESLSRSILSDGPQAATIRKLTKVLYPKGAPLVARALLGELKAYECRATLLHILDREGRRVFGEAMREVEVHKAGLPPRLELRRVDSDPYVVSSNVVYWLEHDAPPAVLEEAARAVVLAKHGLDDALEGGLANDPTLGSVLGALERVLAKYKLGSLHSFLRDEQHERRFQLEARALFRGLLYLLPFSEDEEQILRKLVEPKLDKARTTGAETRKFERAIDGMHYGFWQAWNATDGPKQPRQRQTQETKTTRRSSK